jgi:hypothetical protein
MILSVQTELKEDTDVDAFNKFYYDEVGKDRVEMERTSNDHWSGSIYFSWQKVRDICVPLAASLLGLAVTRSLWRLLRG